MTRSKKLLIFIAIAFFILIGIVSYDISRRTTFPGSKPQLKERINKQYNRDTLVNQSDTVKLEN